MNDRWETEQDFVDIDRLIDGELTRDEERRLLLAIDRRPDGWRRCAIAFLESRAFREEIQSIAGRPARLNGTTVAIKPAVVHCKGGKGEQARSRGERWRNWLTLATCLMIAFCLGVVVRGQWMPASRGDRGEKLIVERDQAQPGPSGREMNSGAAGADDWQFATLTMNVLGADGHKQSEIELPLVEDGGLYAALLRSKPAAVPQQVREALLRRGDTLEEERLLVPVYLLDGRRAIVAVDRAQVSSGMTF